MACFTMQDCQAHKFLLGGRYSAHGPLHLKKATTCRLNEESYPAPYPIHCMQSAVIIIMQSAASMGRASFMRPNREPTAHAGASSL